MDGEPVHKEHGRDFVDVRTKYAAHNRLSQLRSGKTEGKPLAATLTGVSERELLIHKASSGKILLETL